MRPNSLWCIVCTSTCEIRRSFWIISFITAHNHLHTTGFKN